MNNGSTIVIRPARNVSGSLRLPGDKSISHRYAMLAGIAEGKTRLENYSTGADCASTLACLKNLGVDWTRNENTVVLGGRGAKLHAPAAPLNCGNSGSTMRMLSGILAGQDFSSKLIGDESLSRRPMARIIAPLEAMGARISSAGGSRPPLQITGGRLQAIDYDMPVASAQVKSALLFAGLFADGETRVAEPLPTRDHGELALRAFGATVKRQGREARIEGGQKLHAVDAQIPGDLSSASFFMCAAALFPGSHLVINDLLMNPTRTRLVDLLTSMGADIFVSQLEERQGEFRGTLQIRGRSLSGAVVSGADTAALIDEIPVLAAIGPHTSSGIEIRDAKELRVKESDRIAGLATNLGAMGAEVEERADGLRIAGGQKLRGGEVESFGDHRIAMAFAVAALRAEGETQIRQADAAVISYPEFFAVLEKLVQR